MAKQGLGLQEAFAKGQEILCKGAEPKAYALEAAALQAKLSSWQGNAARLGQQVPEAVCDRVGGICRRLHISRCEGLLVTAIAAYQKAGATDSVAKGCLKARCGGAQKALEKEAPGSWSLVQKDLRARAKLAAIGR